MALIVLAFLKMMLIRAWLLWLTLLIVVCLMWLSRKYWLAEALARISAYKIRKYKPKQKTSSHEMLRFYLFHLQRISERYLPPREPSQLLEDWVYVLQDQFGETDHFGHLHSLVSRVVYSGELIEAGEIRRNIENVMCVMMQKKPRL